MKKLEMRELAPYLPYGLKVRFWQITDNIEGEGELYSIDTDKSSIGTGFQVEPVITVGKMELHLDEDIVRPILRPLSDLTKPIIHNGEGFIPQDKLTKDNQFGDFFLEVHDLIKNGMDDDTPVWMYLQLVQWHFDVYRLIEQGLAIDINFLNQ